jgi:hypothetical protein
MRPAIRGYKITPAICTTSPSQIYSIHGGSIIHYAGWLKTTIGGSPWRCFILAFPSKTEVFWIALLEAAAKEPPRDLIKCGKSC